MYAFSTADDARSYSRHSRAISCESVIDRSGNSARSRSRTWSSCSGLTYEWIRQTATASTPSSRIRANRGSRLSAASGASTEPSQRSRSTTSTTSRRGTSRLGLWYRSAYSSLRSWRAIEYESRRPVGHDQQQPRALSLQKRVQADGRPVHEKLDSARLGHELAQARRARRRRVCRSRQHLPASSSPPFRAVDHDEVGERAADVHRHPKTAQCTLLSRSDRSRTMLGRPVCRQL